MKVNRERLVSYIERAYPAVGENPVYPDFHCVHISKGAVWATDGAMVIRTGLLEDPDFTCGVLAKPFLHLLRSVDSEEVELDHKGEDLCVGIGPIQARFNNSSAIQAPDVVAPDCVCDDSAAISQLVEGLAVCKYATNKREIQGPYGGVRLAENTLQSTDGFRTALWSLDKSLTGMRCSIPVMLIDVMVKVKDDISQVGYSTATRKFVVLLHDGTYIGCLTYVGEYPDLLPLFTGLPSDSIEVCCDGQLTKVLERHIGFLSRTKVP